VGSRVSISMAVARSASPSAVVNSASMDECFAVLHQRARRVAQPRRSVVASCGSGGPRGRWWRRGSRSSGGRCAIGPRLVGAPVMSDVLVLEAVTNAPTIEPVGVRLLARTPRLGVVATSAMCVS
jgi:hypothetical protein